MSSLNEFTKAIACTCYGSILGDRNQYDNFRCRVQGSMMAAVAIIGNPKIIELAASLSSANFRELYDDCQDIYKDTPIDHVCSIVSFWIAKQQYPESRNNYGKN